MRETQAITVVRRIAVALGKPLSWYDAGFLLWNETGWPCFIERDETMESHIAVRTVEVLR
jgi:hypothetical protein